MASIKANLLLKKSSSSWWDSTGSSQYYTLTVSKTNNTNEITVKINYEYSNIGHNSSGKTEISIVLVLNIDATGNVTCSKTEGTRHDIYKRFDKYGNTIPESVQDTSKNMPADNFIQYCTDDSPIKNLSDLLKHCNTFLK